MKSILYVEDNVESRLLVRRILESHGFECLEASDAREAISMLESRQPDLILMDVNLPGLSGFEAATRIKGIERFQHIPIVALTAKVLSGDRERALISGCNGYIPKPIDVDTFPQAVSRYLEGGVDTLSAGEELAILKQYTRHLVDRLEQTIDISLTDELTGVGNQTFARLRITEELARCRRYKAPSSLLLFDIDGLKAINSKFGFDAGNEVLKSTAKLLSNNRRRFDILVRLSKDEFLMMLYNVDVETARKVAERILSQAATWPYVFGNRPVPVSLTIRGIRMTLEDSSPSAKDILALTSDGLSGDPSGLAEWFVLRSGKKIEGAS